MLQALPKGSKKTALQECMSHQQVLNDPHEGPSLWVEDEGTFSN